MMQLISILQKRPKDKTIIISRIIFSIIYISIVGYNFLLQENPNTIQESIFWIQITETIASYIIYIIIALWIFPLIIAVTKACIVRKKIMRYMQVVFAIVLFYASSLITEWPNLDIDSLIFLMAFGPLICGITGKCITSNCMKYWEKITKIRV